MLLVTGETLWLTQLFVLLTIAAIHFRALRIADKTKRGVPSAGHREPHSSGGYALDIKPRTGGGGVQRWRLRPLASHR